MVLAPRGLGSRRRRGSRGRTPHPAGDGRCCGPDRPRGLHRLRSRAPTDAQRERFGVRRSVRDRRPGVLLRPAGPLGGLRRRLRLHEAQGPGRLRQPGCRDTRARRRPSPGEGPQGLADPQPRRPRRVRGGLRACGPCRAHAPARRRLRRCRLRPPRGRQLHPGGLHRRLQARRALRLRWHAGHPG